MLCSSCRNSCLVWISFLPIFWQLHLDQWVWIHHWFPPKWWLLSWLHLRVIPAKTAKVGSAQNLGRPSHVTWMTKEHTGLWLEKWVHGKSGLNLRGCFILCYPWFYLLQYIDVNITQPGLPGFLAYPNLTLFAGITPRCGQLSNHHKGVNQWWVQIHWTRWITQKMDREKIQT